MLRDRKNDLSIVPPLHRATHRIGILLEPTGLSQGECHLLAHLHRADGCPIGELHAAFAHKRSTLTSYLDRMEERRLVRRRLRPEDRRSFRVELTAAGKRAARKVHQRLAALERAVARKVKARDLAGFRAVLTAIQELP